MSLPKQNKKSVRTRKKSPPISKTPIVKQEGIGQSPNSKEDVLEKDPALKKSSDPFQNYQASIAVVFGTLMFIIAIIALPQFQKTEPSDIKNNSSTLIPNDTLILEADKKNDSSHAISSALNVKTIVTPKLISAAPPKFNGRAIDSVDQILPISSAYFPTFRLTSRNKSESSIVITGLHVKILGFLNGKGPSLVSLIAPISDWIVCLPNEPEIGDYLDFKANLPIEVPPSSVYSLDILFMCKYGDYFVNPMDLGSWNLMASLTTLTDDTIRIKSFLTL